MTSSPRCLSAISIGESVPKIKRSAPTVSIAHLIAAVDIPTKLADGRGNGVEIGLRDQVALAVIVLVLEVRIDRCHDLVEGR